MGLWCGWPPTQKILALKSRGPVNFHGQGGHLAIRLIQPSIWDYGSGKYMAPETIDGIEVGTARITFGGNSRVCEVVIPIDCKEPVVDWAGDTLVLVRRLRWWGVFYLWEFWLTVVFAGVFVWSVVRDRRVLKARASG